MSAAAAAATRAPVDDDGTMFFGDAPAAGGGAGLRGPGAGPAAFDDVALVDDPATFDAQTAFAPLSGPGQEPSAARLAARAEPLDDALGPAPRAAGRRPSARSPRPAGGPKPPGRPGERPRSGGRRKPKEPSAVLLGLGLGLVILAGIAAAYFLTRGDEEATGSEVETPIDVTTSVPTDTTVDTVAAPVTTQPPSVTFDEAAGGPIAAGTEYQIGVNGGPEGALYQLLVDGAPQAEPAAELPPTVFEPGRHLLEVAITGPAGDVSTDPVVVYAVGEVSGVTYRANLSSVDIQTEGWAEAIRRFDEFAVNHPELELMPSDWFPSLAPGYWNLFVDGFDSRDEAEAYCTATGLSIPDQCWGLRFDPDAPAG